MPLFGSSLGNLTVYLRMNATQYERGLRTAEQQLRGASMRFRSIGRSMSMYVTAPLALIGGASVKAFANFDQAMTESLAIMKNVSPEMRREMEMTARTISTESITSAQDLARGYYYLASAGMTASQSVKNLGVVDEFARAGAFDLSQATALLAKAQAALGLKTADTEQNMRNMVRVSDVLVRANTLAQGSVEDFSRALTNKAAASFRLLGKSVEEGVAMLAVFLEQGLSAQRAGQAAEIVNRDLQRATIKNAAAWQKMGLAVYDSTGTMRSYADIIADLSAKFSTMSDRQKKVTAMQLGFQARSFSYLQVLLGQSEALRRFQFELEGAGGTTKRVADNQMKSFTNQMLLLKNQVIDVAIGIGETLAPYVLKLNEHIKKGLQWWKGLSRQARLTIILVAGVAAAIGPALIAFGFLTQGVAALVAAFRLLTLVGWKWIAIGALIGVAMWAVVDAFSEADLGFQSFVNGIRIGGTTIETWMTALSTYIWQSFDWALNKIKIAWEGWKQATRNVLEAIGRFGLNIAIQLLESFDKVLQKLGKLAKPIIEGLRMAKIISQETADEFTTALEGMKGNVEEFSDEMKASFEKAIKDSFAGGEKRGQEYYAKLAGLDEEYKKQAAIWDELRLQTHLADPEKVSPGLRESFGKLGGAIMDLPGFKQLKGFLDDFFKSVPKELAAPDIPGAPGIDPEAARRIAGGPMAAVTEVQRMGQFQQIALNRLSLAGLAGAPPTQEKQMIEAPGINDRLDTLIGLQEQSNVQEENEAVLVS